MRRAIRSFLLAALVGAVALAWVTSVLAAPGDRATPMRQAIIQALTELGIVSGSGAYAVPTADSVFESGATVSIAGAIVIDSTGGSISVGSGNGAGTYLSVTDTDAILFATGLGAMSTDDLTANVVVTASTDDVTVKADNEEVVTVSGAGLTVSAGNQVSAPTVVASTATIVGTADTSGIRLDVTSGALEVREGDDSAYGQIVALTVNAQTAFHINSTDTQLTRSAGNVARFGSGTTNLDALLAGALVEDNTAGSGAPNVITVGESASVFTNTGATAENYHTLPAAAGTVGGMYLTFIVTDTDGIRVVAAGDDTIRQAATVSGAAGYIRAATIGNVITLQSISATEWIVVSFVGTWTIDS